MNDAPAAAALPHVPSRLGRDALGDVITFAQGCALLRIAERTAERKIADLTSDFPRPYRNSPRGMRFFRRSQIEAYIARKSDEAQVCQAAAPARENCAA